MLFFCNCHFCGVQEMSLFHPNWLFLLSFMGPWVQCSITFMPVHGGKLRRLFILCFQITNKPARVHPETRFKPGSDTPIFSHQQVPVQTVGDGNWNTKLWSKSNTAHQRQTRCSSFCFANKRGNKDLTLAHRKFTW